MARTLDKLARDAWRGGGGALIEGAVRGVEGSPHGRRSAPC